MTIHKIRPYLILIKPMTDVSKIRMVERKCACGCGYSFRAKWGSEQKFKSIYCAGTLQWNPQKQFVKAAM